MKKIILLIFISIIFVSACKKVEVHEITYSDLYLLSEKASPIILGTDSTIIYLSDYIPQKTQINSIITDKAIKSTLSKDSSYLNLKIISADLPQLSVLKIKLTGVEYSILLKKSLKGKYKIKFDSKGKTFKNVAVKGEFNSWNPLNSPLKNNNGIWETEIEIEPGRYQYLFVVDGKETKDPDNSETVSNGMGGFNSVLNYGSVDKTKIPYLYTISAEQNFFTIGNDNDIDSIIIFYKNFSLDKNFISKTKEGNYKIVIPDDAKSQRKTYMRIWAYNNSGVSNDLFIPVENGQVIKNASQVTRDYFESAVLYNVFVDRFFDGNTKNNRPTPDKSILPKANYFGGDIAGATKKIEDGFFEKLGINTIWISPVVKNPEGAFGKYINPNTKFSAYHGYWPISFTLIDNRFGTEEDFKKFVETAHKHNLNVLLDFVAHHVHEESSYYQSHKNFTTNLYLPDGTLNTERWDDYRLTTWFDVFLPTLDLSNPEVSNMLSDSAVYWIKKYNLDGFRHDATKHIPEIFWRTLTLKLKNQISIPEKRTIYQIGETYGTPELISSYVNTGQLDAQFDFNVYDAVSTAIAGNNSFKNLADVISTSHKYYGWHNLMGNITGNQDRGRFISYAGGSLKFDEDSKRAGWTRNITAGNPESYKKSEMLIAFISTMTGIPVIYYGDEIGMPGGNDPDNRRMMKFENLSSEEMNLKDKASQLIKFRKNSLALIFGDFKILYTDENVLIYQRTYFDKIVIFAMNKSSESKKINFNIEKRFKSVELKTLFDEKFESNSQVIKTDLQANSFLIFYN